MQAPLDPVTFRLEPPVMWPSRLALVVSATGCDPRFVTRSDVVSNIGED